MTTTDILVTLTDLAASLSLIERQSSPDTLARQEGHERGLLETIHILSSDALDRARRAASGLRAPTP